MKNKIKAGMFLIDDVKIVYKVIEVFKNSAVVTPVTDISSDFSCEIMTFEAMESEKWTLLKSI